LHLDEILQLGEMRAGDGHEINDGHDLLRKSQRITFGEPQICLIGENFIENGFFRSFLTNNSL